MKISYKGIQKAIAPKLQEKLDAKFAKLSKLVEKRGEKEAHVVVTSERHLHCAEITVQFYDHQLVGLGSDADVFTAVHTALEKLEKQAVKQLARWREMTRRADISLPEKPLSKPALTNGKAAGKTNGKNAAALASPRVYRVNHRDGQKPMTLEEAMLEMDRNTPYFVYRNAEKDGTAVLVRRRDGNFDLIES